MLTSAFGGPEMKKLIAAAALALVVGACATPQRMDAAAAAPEGELIVSGSRIERPVLESAREGLTFADQPALMAVVADPPRDEKHPARNRQLLVQSGGQGMNALFFLASGEGPKPTMLLLHGLPGNERNLDLAQAVRRAGWNVLTFTYRGAWGSPGTFSIKHAMEDSVAALMFLRSAEAAASYGVDARRIVIAGHSMGGFAAAYAAAKDPPGDPPLAGVILMDALNVGKAGVELKAGGAEARAGFIAGFDDVGNSLGPIKAPDLADELIRRGSGWSIAPFAPALSRLPILNIAASEGNAAEMHAFSGAIGRFGRANVTHKELATDHSFADKRIALAVEVVRWLSGLAAR